MFLWLVKESYCLEYYPIINTSSGLYLQIDHYLQIVKTEVITGRSNKLIEEYEYTAHSSLIQSLNIPVAKFHFELSPMQV